MSTVLSLTLEYEKPGGGLCRFEPKFRGGERAVRSVTIDRTEIHEWLDDETSGRWTLEKKALAKGHFGHFVRGELIDDCEFMKRVDDRRRAPWSMDHGVWAMRPLVHPQYRFFGFFVTYNWFLVLSKESRDVLENENGWHAQIDKVTKRWCDLFPGALPFVRSTLDEFVSNAEKCDDRW